MKTYTITVDIMDNTSQDVHSLPVYNQGDINTSVLNLNITQDEVPYDLTGSTVSVFFIKSDGTVVYQDSTNGLSVTNAIGGAVSVSLNTQTLAALGRVIGAVKIQNGNSTLETGGFYFVVKKSLTSEQALASDNEVSPILGTATLTTTDKSIKGAINEVNANKADKTTVGDLATLTTADKDTLVHAINDNVNSLSGVNTSIGNLSNLTTSDKSSLVNAINTTVTTKADKTALGDITTLTTQNKTNVVAAINENVSSLAENTKVLQGKFNPDSLGLVYNDPTADNAPILETVFNTYQDITLSSGILYTKRNITITQQNVRIHGALVEQTQIIMNGATGDCINIGINGGSSIGGLFIENLQLQSRATVQVDASAIGVNALSRAYIKNCWLQNSVGYGLVVRGHAYDLRVIESYITGNSIGGVWYQESANQQNDIMFFNCMNFSNGPLDGQTGQAIKQSDTSKGNNYSVSGMSTKIIGGTIENCGGAGVQINNGTTSGLVIMGVHFEAGKRSCVEFLKLPTDCFINGNYFLNDSGRDATINNLTGSSYTGGMNVQTTQTIFDYTKVNSGTMKDFYGNGFSLVDDGVSGKVYNSTTGGWQSTNLKLYPNAKNHVKMIIRPLATTTLYWTMNHYAQQYLILDAIMGVLQHTGYLQVTSVGSGTFTVSNNTNLTDAQIMALFNVANTGSCIVGMNPGVTVIGGVDFYTKGIYRVQDLSLGSNAKRSLFHFESGTIDQYQAVITNPSSGVFTFSSISNMQNVIVGTRFVLGTNSGGNYLKSTGISPGADFTMEFDVDLTNVFCVGYLGFYCPVANAFSVVDAYVTKNS